MASNLFERAIAEVLALPDAAQDSIGQELLEHVSQLKTLRSEIAAGLNSLDGGRGQPLDIEEVIRRARQAHISTYPVDGDA